MWACIFCGRAVTEIKYTCDKCKAVVYCGSRCQRLDLIANNGDYRHNKWCTKLQMFIANGADVIKHPFSFAEVTTSPSFTPARYKCFLEQQSVYSLGLWRTALISKEKGAKVAAVVDDDVNPYILPEGEILSSKPSKLQIVDSWLEYYSLRGLPLSSPLSILLSHPLTIYHVIRQHYDCGVSLPGCITVDLIGVEKEVECLAVYKELAHLIPDVTIHLRMFGDNVASSTRGVALVYENLTVEIFPGFYHDCVTDRPHLAIGLNAGLPAYQGWCDTLKLLKEWDVPACFSDYCEFSCELSRLPVEALNVGTIGTPRINPFRSPVREEVKEHLMVAFSNCFLFDLIYHDSTSE